MWDISFRAAACECNTQIPTHFPPKPPPLHCSSSSLLLLLLVPAACSPPLEYRARASWIGTYIYTLARARACNAHRASNRLRNAQRAREIQRASETSQRVSQSQRASEHVNPGFRELQSAATDDIEKLIQSHNFSKIILSSCKPF